VIKFWKEGEIEKTRLKNNKKYLKR